MFLVRLLTFLTTLPTLFGKLKTMKSFLKKSLCFKDAPVPCVFSTEAVAFNICVHMALWNMLAGSQEIFKIVILIFMTFFC